MSVNAKMTAIANPLRTLSGTSEKMNLDAMASHARNAADTSDTQGELLDTALALIAGKAVAVPVLQEKNVSPSTDAQEVSPDEGYDGLSKVTIEAMPTAQQAVPAIVVDADGKITASATQEEGYVAAGIKSAKEQLAVQAAKTIMPGTSDQAAIASGTYATGDVTVKGDANLLAGNIKSGVSIFGVSGSYEGKSSLPSGISALATGTITPESDITEDYYIQHNLGVIPNFIIVEMCESAADGMTNALVQYVELVKVHIAQEGVSTWQPERTVFGSFYDSTGRYDSGNLAEIGDYAYANPESRFCIWETMPIKAGHTYRWVCGVMDGIL